MATRDDEIKDLKEKNNELVQKVQYWKMTAGQRENEKLALMKEINELRLKLSRLRSTGGVQARNFETAIQATSEKALAHLVRASGEIAHTIELAKGYMRDRQELDASSPRWSAISGTPSTKKTERVHRVPPMMMGGQSIQPVVALSRTLFNTNTQPASRSPNQNRSLTNRAMPMHMLQDVYIPLTRIDADRQMHNGDGDSDAQDADNSAEDLGLEDDVERMDESQEASGSEDFDASRRLDAVTEDIEPEDEVQTPPRKIDNPLEGPSWLLDSPEADQSPVGMSRVALEPDSTTELDGADTCQHADTLASAPACVSRCVFTPTMRRRKRTRSPLSPARPHSPSPRHAPSRRNSNSGRVLKVLVAKMRLSSGEEELSPKGASPPKRSAPSVAPALHSPSQLFARFDAPSPNGATDTALLVSDTETQPPLDGSVSELAKHNRRDSRHDTRHDSRHDSRHDTRHERLDSNSTVRKRSDQDERGANPHCMEGGERSRLASVDRGSRAGSDSSLASSDARDSDGDTREGRTRRPRKPVTYKEKPLNRKMRR